MTEVHARPVYATLKGKREEVVSADNEGQREREREVCLRRVESLIRLVIQTVHKTTKAAKS